VRNVLPKWAGGPASSVTGAVGTVNAVSKLGLMSISTIATTGTPLACAAGIGTIVTAGATAYEGATWVGSFILGVEYIIFPAHVEEMMGR